MMRDFVVQLRPEADIRLGRFEGRVEHVDSGRSAHFRNADEFFAFLAGSITPEPAKPSASDR